MIIVRKNISVKYDGVFVVVFGINLVNGKFFVGIKFVFNKKFVKINYINEDIDKNYIGNVVDIFCLCLYYFFCIVGII